MTVSIPLCLCPWSPVDSLVKPIISSSFSDSDFNSKLALEKAY